MLKSESLVTVPKSGIEIRKKERKREIMKRLGRNYEESCHF